MYNLKKTGERVIEKEYMKCRSEYFIYMCHVATYNFVIPYVKGKNILEFGCGSGYGSHILADHCQHITAVDISSESILYAQDNYKSENLVFKQISNIENHPLEFDDDSFDVIISFQVIEHLSNDKAYINQLYRVLKENGKIIIVTPNKTYRLYSFQKPWNMYHIKEYNMKELSNTISNKFKIIDSLYMSARKDLIKMEINRTKKMRFLALPFTIFFIPEKIRIALLSFLKKITLKKHKSTTNTSVNNYDFNTEDIYMTKSKINSINLIIVAEKTRSLP